MRQPSQQDRLIRVFISSTFRDMQAERDQLMKFIFPQLRKLCQQRGVTFTEVDLRWGITKEQAERGDVLPICLGEIERCRPFFICMLGERYGWVPDQITPQLIDEQPWLADHRERSVTELEIIHGVLNNPAMGNRGVFYFRDPGYVDQIPPSQRADFVEEDERARQKLAGLKERIRCSGPPVHEGYSDPQSLGRMVLEHLTVAINQEYPPESRPDPLDRAGADHGMFAQSRAGVSIGRQEDFDRLDEHAQGDGPPLVILGDSGCGKSALVANWALRYRAEHPDDLVLMHFIGATPYGADWAAMLRRIMGELKRQFRIEQDIPQKPDELRAAFVNWLHVAADGGRVVLILDALNQLEDRDGAPDLGWLPKEIPGNVRLIVSTLPGRPLQELERRGWPKLQVQLLQPAKRRILIEQYLAQYIKRLSSNQLVRIASAAHTGNPLYLRAVLDELRVFGVHEQLDARIEHYLAAGTVDDLYERILSRYEEDYEGDQQGLVRNATSLIWASRRGLSETELLALLGTADSPLPTAYWAALHLAAEQSLVNRSGLIGFAHEYLRKAVEDKYLPTVEEQRKAHLRLADYFETQEIGDRTVEELPWQYEQAADAERLRDCLSNLDIFGELNSEHRRYELLHYWQSLGNRYDPYEVYSESLNRLEPQGVPAQQVASSMNAVANFLSLASCFAGAEQLYQRALELRTEVLGPDHGDTSTSLHNLGLALRDRGDYDGAEEYLQRAVELDERISGPRAVATANSAASLAELLELKGDLERAEELYRRALKIRENAFGPEHPDVALSLHGLSILLSKRAEWEDAESCCRRALQIRERNFGRNDPTVAISRSALASLRKGQGDLDEAERLFRQAIPVLERTCGHSDPSTTIVLSNFALLLDEKGDVEEAEQLLTRVLETHVELFGPQHPFTATAQCNLAALLEARGDVTKAEALNRSALATMEKKLGVMHPSTDVVRDALCQLLETQGDAAGSEQLLRHAVEAAEKDYGRDHPAVSQTLCRLLRLLDTQDDDQATEQVLRRLVTVCINAFGENHRDTGVAMNNLGLLLRNKGDFDEALALYGRAIASLEAACGSVHPDTSMALDNQARLLAQLAGDHNDESLRRGLCKTETWLFMRERSRYTELPPDKESDRRSAV